MRNIKKNGRVTTGSVISARSAIGWLWVSSYGNQDRPLIRYQSPNGNELILEVTTSSVLPKRSYQPGEAVKIIYDVTMPGRAYTPREWESTLNDIWIGSGAFVLAIILWILASIYTPF